MNVDSEENTIVVSSPGNLINQIPIDKVDEFTSLKLIGKLNGTDFLTLNKCPNIRYLDLSEADIVSGGMPYYEKDNQRFGTEDDVLGQIWSYNLDNLMWVALPESISMVAEKAFYNKSNLSTITIPTNVKEVGSSAFYGGSGLKEITIADGETNLKFGENVFSNVNPTKLYLGRNFTYSGSQPPFQGKSSLKELTIGNSVTSIGNYAFYGCNGLISVEIPYSVTSIGNGAFYYCSGIKEITIADGETNIEFGSGVFYNVKMTKLYLGRNFTFSGYNSDAPFYKKSTLTDLTIGNSVTSIGASAFSGCSGLTSVEIPNSVTSIDYEAFENCSGLISVEIPYSVTSIGNGAFYHCSGIKEITIADGKRNIEFGSGVFSNVYPTKLYLGRNFTYSGYASSSTPFYGMSSLTELTIGNSVTSIGNYAFYGCNGLTSVEIPNSVTAIGNRAFSDCRGLNKAEFASIKALCNIKFGDSYSNPLYYAHHLWIDDNEIHNLIIPESVTKINDYAFNGCSGLTSVKIPNSVTSIGSYAFYGCSGLTAVEIPNSVTAISSSTFYGCSGLTAVEIPNSVTAIDSSAFYGCSGLTAVEIPNSVTAIGSSAFFSCSGLILVEIPNSVTAISSSTFYGCSGLTSVEIPNSVTSIGGSAFSGCSRLTSVDIPNSVTSIGDGAFYNCSGLKEITIADGKRNLEFGEKVFVNVKPTKLYLGRNFTYSGSQPPFQSKSSLNELTIGNSVTSIGQSAFYGCSGLKSVEIPNSVTSIGNSAFSGCSGLISAKLPQSLASIASNTFYGCSKLDSINIPDPVQKIEESAFYSCSALTSITLPGSLREVGSSAFSGCSNLSSVEVINPIPPVIESNTFSSASLASLLVPEGSRNIYWIHPYWGKFKSVGIMDVEENPVFVADNVTYRVTSEEDQTVEVTAAYLMGRKAELEIPAEVMLNGKSYRVAGIANNGFENVAVASVSLPHTIGYVGLEAFKGCGALRAVECNATTPPSVYNNSFDDQTYSAATLNVPEESISVYKSNSVWGLFNITSLEIPVESIEVDPSIWTGTAGDKFAIVATVYPSDATNQTLEWSSSDESIATVDETGNVTVLKSGVCEITARATDGSGVEAVCRLDVTSGLDVIEEDSDSLIRVFNLNGVLILSTNDNDYRHHLEKGIYIVRQGKTSKKIVVK